MTAEVKLTTGHETIFEPGVGEKPNFLGQAPTLTHWIAQNPQEAVDFAREVLPPYRFPTFRAYVLGTMENGMTSTQIAEALGTGRKSYLDEVKNARKIISRSMGIPFDHVTGNRLLDFYRENQAQKLFSRAKEGDIRSTVSLMMLAKKELGKHTKNLPEQSRAEYTAYVTAKIIKKLPEIEWQGLASIANWLRSVYHTCYLDEIRRQSLIAATKAESPTIKKIPEDLLTLWYIRHPQRAQVILQTFSDKEREAFRLSLSNVPHERIAEIIGSSSAESVKVQILKARRKLAERAGVKLPREYKNITEFPLTNQEAEALRKHIKTGRLKGFLYFNGKYYLTDQLFESYKSLEKGPETPKQQEAN